jgi:hypothetical protein
VVNVKQPIALTPLDSLEAQNASIRAAGGGIFGGIATELLNLSPTSKMHRLGLKRLLLVKRDDEMI